MKKEDFLKIVEINSNNMKNFLYKKLSEDDYETAISLIYSYKTSLETYHNEAINERYG